MAQELEEFRTRLSPIPIWRRWWAKPIRPSACEIKELFAFRGVLFVRGIIHTPEYDYPKIYVAIGDSLILVPDVRPDPHVPSGPGILGFEFHLSRRDPFTNACAKQSYLIFEFSDFLSSKSDILDNLYRSDRFLASGTAFWENVKSATRPRVLEIGSRARSGIARRILFPSDAEYTGLDILPGENVTVVGDVHQMTDYLPYNHFDFAFSVSVWEHLHAPWLAAIQLNKVLKIGGLALINSHQAWPYHEGPWDYFRFSESAWKSLFNEATGFEVLEKGFGQRCVMTPTHYNEAISDSGIEWEYGYLASRCVVKKICETDHEWKLTDIPSQSQQYPA